MSFFKNPFDPNTRLGMRCACGQHNSQAEHDQQLLCNRWKSVPLKTQ